MSTGKEQRVLEIRDLRANAGDKEILKGIDLTVNAGEVHAVMGPNGSGKSTVFRLITGEEHADDGVVDRPKRTTIGYFRQDVEEMSGRSVLDEAIAVAREQVRHQRVTAFAVGGHQFGSSPVRRG